MNNQSFEDYLRMIHDQQYIGLKDDAPDDYEDWIANQNPMEIVEHAEHFFKLIGGTHDRE